MNNMGKFKVIAKGETEKNRANNRGKLFEFLMAKVLRHYGYRIEKKPNVNYAGMEIDIEGKEKISEYPLYAECKCYEIELNTRSLEIFYGKYMTRWFTDKKAIGLFIALPGINSHAKAWFKENIETNKEIRIRLFQEEEILSLIFEEYPSLNPSVIKKKIPKKIGKLGDWVLLYSDHGFFIIQYIIPSRSGIPSHYIIFDMKADLITDSKTIDYLINLYHELKSFEIVKEIDSNDFKIINSVDNLEQVVEVLARNKVVDSKKGPSGGYTLNEQMVAVITLKELAEMFGIPDDDSISMKIRYMTISEVLGI